MGYFPDDKINLHAPGAECIPAMKKSYRLLTLDTTITFLAAMRLLCAEMEGGYGLTTRKNL